jgi:hypothetical protein
MRSKISDERKIRAFYTKDFIKIYQAYNSDIASSAVKHQKLISPPFKKDRTTWIKPSFCWMMYRSGWATKKNQGNILAIDITHQGFNWALKNSCLSHFDNNTYQDYEDWRKEKNKAPVIIQWDPERDIFSNKLNYRSIQIGLMPNAAGLYANEWILKVTDVTDLVIKIKSLIDNKKMAEASELLPVEENYTFI